MSLLSAKSHLNWLMHVEDIASQSSVVFETPYTACLKRHNFRGACSCLPR